MGNVGLFLIWCPLALALFTITIGYALGFALILFNKLQGKFKAHKRKTNKKDPEKIAKRNGIEIREIE